MKIRLLLSIASVALVVSGAVFATKVGDISVPFDSFALPAASYIGAHYHFDSHREVLVCEAEGGDASLMKVKWTYKDVSYAASLPVRLKDDEHFDGQFADPTGRLIISNPYGGEPNQGSVLLACHYETVA